MISKAKCIQDLTKQLWQPDTDDCPLYNNFWLCILDNKVSITTDPNITLILRRKKRKKKKKHILSVQPSQLLSCEHTRDFNLGCAEWDISVEAMTCVVRCLLIMKYKFRSSPVLAETISLNWDTGVTQTLRTSGQPVDPRYPSDRFQTTGFSRGRGGSDTSLTVAMPTASSLRTIPHHPGIGKCSWSLLVGCKGKKNSS